MNPENAQTKEYLSVSRLKCFLRCPLQFYFKYVEKIPAPIDGNLLLGKALHAAAETNFRQKISSRKDISRVQILEMFNAAFESLKQQEEVILKEDQSFTELKVTGLKCTEILHAELAPAIQPVFIEQHFTFPLINSQFAGFQGFVDVVDSSNVVHDIKTAKKSYVESAAQTDLQLIAYNIGCRTFLKEPPRGFAFDVLVKNKTVKLQTVSTPGHTQAQLDRFIKLVHMVEQAMISKVFYPSENTMSCSFCSYKEQCKKW